MSIPKKIPSKKFILEIEIDIFVLEFLSAMSIGFVPGNFLETKNFFPYMIFFVELMSTLRISNEDVIILLDSV